MLAAINPKPKTDGSTKGTFGGGEKTLPQGVEKKQSHYAQQMNNHKEIDYLITSVL